MPALILIALGTLLIGGCLKTREIEDPLPPDGGDASPPDGKDVDFYTDAPIDSGPDLGPDACTLPMLLFRDLDEDGYGNPEEPSEACLMTKEGYVDNSQDCNDAADAINPDAIEQLGDDIDNDCDGITNLDAWRIVTSGGSHSCGITLAGSVHCWGLNDQDQAPTDVLPGEVFSQVSAGVSHSCGVLESGTLYCWGALSVPPQFADDTFNGVGCGWDHTCATLAADNSGVCWGSDEEGQSTLPMRLTGEALAEITAGWRHTCVRKLVDGAADCWGLNANNRTDYPAGVLFSKISAGWGHNCGIVSLDNTLECWGYQGDFGDGPAVIPPELVGATFNRIGAGAFHSCGLLTSGVLQCWGASADGQSTPPEGAFIEVGESKGPHSCGVTAENTIQCWGNNDYGQAPAILSL